jgi:O-antigen/teichoic acid export membrane protein
VVLAAPLLGLLFGDAFVAGSPALRLVALSVALFALHGITRSVFVALHRTRLEATIFAFAAAVNIGLNFLLIPTLGIVGAAVATVAAEAIIFVACVIWLARIGAQYPAMPLLRPAVASLLMAAALTRFVQSVPVLPLILGGGVLYLTLMVVSGAIRIGPTGVIVGEH